MPDIMIIIPNPPAPLPDNATEAQRNAYLYSLQVFNAAVVAAAQEKTADAQTATATAHKRVLDEQAGAHYPTRVEFIERTEALMAQAVSNDALARAMEKAAAAQSKMADAFLSPPPQATPSQRLDSIALALMEAGVSPIAAWAQARQSLAARAFIEGNSNA